MLITRIGRRDDPKRALIQLTESAAGSYSGTLYQKDFMTSTYGNSLADALHQSFYWAGIKVYTVFDAVRELAQLLEEEASDDHR